MTEPNLRALCTELLEALEDEWIGDKRADPEIVIRARAALAQPAPVAYGEVGELVAALRADAECAEVEHYDLCNMTAGQMRRAADLLERQQPATIAPTDEELLSTAAGALNGYASSGIAVGEYEAETECAVEAYGSELIAFARAVLARWGGQQGGQL